MNYDIKGEAFYIPDSIICAQVNGKDVHIIGLSENSLRLRMPFGAPAVVKLAVTYYDFSANVFASCELPSFEEADSEDKEYYMEKLIIVKDNKLFSAIVRDILKGYYRYIKIKTEDIENSAAKALTGYPAELDSITPDTYDEWLDGVKEDSEALLEKVLSLNMGDEAVAAGRTVELAVAFERAEELLDALEEFRDESLEACDSSDCEKRLVSQAQRYYVGSAFCHRIYPSIPQLEELIKALKPMGKNLTAAISFLRDSEIEAMEDYFMDLLWILEAYDFNIEIEVNDFGYLAMFARMGESFCKRVTPILGPLLNKRRKDPRYKYKLGMSEAGEKLLAQNQTNSCGFAEYLAGYGVERFEYEACGYDFEVADARKGHSLHLPVYQTNTSESCTLHAACTSGKRGAQNGASNEAELRMCQEYCRDYFFAYPLHTGLVGRGNSLFAVDERLMAEPELLDKYIEKGIDRIVWNLK